MPRRIPDFPDAYAGWNAIASYGSYLSVLAALVFFYVVFITLTKDATVAENPWELGTTSSTVEWLLKSPPSFHTFEEVPTIRHGGPKKKLIDL